MARESSAGHGRSPTMRRSLNFKLKILSPPHATHRRRHHQKYIISNKSKKKQINSNSQFEIIPWQLSGTGKRRPPGLSNQNVPTIDASGSASTLGTPSQRPGG